MNLSEIIKNIPSKELSDAYKKQILLCAGKPFYTIKVLPDGTIIKNKIENLS